MEIKMLIIDSTVYPISVTLGTIEEQVLAGNYICFNANIQDKNFTADQPHSADIVLCECDETMGTDAVLKALDEKDLRPATMSEVLALGSQHPELQRSIVALGSVWRSSDGSCVGYLSGRSGKRLLLLHLITDHWNHTSYFAAVSKAA
jgi:hypothetical protein